MAPQEQTEIVQYLERSRSEFLAAVAGLNESQAKARPDPERWSVLDCVEHVTLVEERFLGFLDAAEKQESPSIDKEKEGRLIVGFVDRSTRLKAPEAVVPTGRFATLEEALDKFNANRTRSIQFAEDRCDDLYCLTSAHPRLGPMNGAEFLILIGSHARRHAEQIRETRAVVEQS
jgi:hypothetical protein